MEKVWNLDHVVLSSIVRFYMYERKKIIKEFYFNCNQKISKLTSDRRSYKKQIHMLKFNCFLLPPFTTRNHMVVRECL